MLVTAAVLGGAAYLAWAWRPAPSVDASGPPPPARTLLVDARPDGALTLKPLSGLATAYGADGEQLWVSDRLADRFDIACAPGCREAIGSATGESVSRPEISDPPVIRVGVGGARQLPGAGPRQRVLWWQDESTYVLASSDRLGGVVDIESVAAGRASAVLTGLDPGALVQMQVDGDDGALLVTGSSSQVLLIERVGDDRWKALGRPAPAPNLATGCLAAVQRRPVAGVVDDRGLLLVREAGAVRIEGVGGGVIDCAVTSSGIVVATADGEATRVDYLDFSGTQHWTRSVPGTAQLSATGADDLVSVMALEAQGVTVLNRQQEIVASFPADDARLVGHTLVTVRGDAAPRWSAVP